MWWECLDCSATGVGEGSDAEALEHSTALGHATRLWDPSRVEEPEA